MTAQSGNDESKVVLDLVKCLKKHIDLIPDSDLINAGSCFETVNGQSKMDHTSLIIDLQGKIAQLKAKRLERSREFESNPQMDVLAEFIDSFASKSSLMQLGDAMFSQFFQDSEEEAKEKKLPKESRHINSKESLETMKLEAKQTQKLPSMSTIFSKEQVGEEISAMLFNQLQHNQQELASLYQCKRIEDAASED